MSLLTNPWFSVGMGLLANSGPSLAPVNPWRGIGQGLMAANEAKAAEAQQAYEQQRMAMEQQKMAEEQRRQQMLQQWAQTQPDPTGAALFPEEAYKQAHQPQVRSGKAGDLGISYLPPEMPIQIGADGSIKPIDLPGQTQAPGPIQEYNLAQQQGFQGTYQDWIQQKARMGRDPGAAALAQDNKQFTQEEQLRDDFNKQSAPFVIVRDAYAKIKASDPTPAGDMSLIFGYMKILDPGSTVREGEYATAENAGSVPNRVQQLYNKVLSGEKLTDSQRKDFKKQATGVYKAARQSQQSVVDQYKHLSGQYGIDPQKVIYDHGGSVSPMEFNDIPPPPPGAVIDQ